MIPPQAAAELAAQHLVLVAQHQQCGVLGRVRPDQHRQQAEQVPHQAVGERRQHAAIVTDRGSGKGVIPAEEPELLMALRLGSAAELTMVVQPFLAPPGDLADLRVYRPVPRLPGAVRSWRADLVLAPGPHG